MISIWNEWERYICSERRQCSNISTLFQAQILSKLGKFITIYHIRWGQGCQHNWILKLNITFWLNRNKLIHYKRNAIILLTFVYCSMKELKMYNLLRDLFIYVMFVIALCQVSYSHLDPQSFFVRKAVEDTFVHGAYGGKMALNNVSTLKCSINRSSLIFEGFWSDLWI